MRKAATFYIKTSKLNTRQLSAQKKVRYTVKLRCLEGVGTILTSPNHPKCELNSHFGWFWLVKIAPTARIWVQKDKKRNIVPADVFESTTYSKYPCSSYRGLTIIQNAELLALFSTYFQRTLYSACLFWYNRSLKQRSIIFDQITTRFSTFFRTGLSVFRTDLV